jgi:hypothetical protein
MTSLRIREWAAAGFLAGGLALSGCGSDERVASSATHTATPAQTATPKAPAALPGGLRGSWKRTMKARDWRRAGRGYPVGTWRFDVARNGEVGVYYPRTAAVDFTTQFAVSGRRLTIESIPICPGQTGRYRWRASEGGLRLTVVDDHACKARAALFGGRWTRRR